ncbi:MAG: DNA gyrase inhibitor YacG [Rhodobacteraceae bacterium]|nr:DNA gyrase inhibitor YacG [Paracoccaceae bacterium]
MTCPVCNKPTSESYRPFCSRRCADVDLGRWLKGNYVIETDEVPDPFEDQPDQKPH